jgi:acetyl-CoA synthetase
MPDDLAPASADATPDSSAPGRPNTATTADATHPTIANLLDETRAYPAPAAIAASANVDASWWARADADPDAFWAEQAARLDWHTPWQSVHTWKPAAPDASGALSVPETTWFAGGRLNVAVNCVDRHVQNGLGDKVAVHFEGEPGDRRSLTYAELQREVSKAANALTDLGIGVGDRVVIYLPVIPETIIATLAVARIGAIHSLVFGGFSAEALRFRVEDTRAKLLITTDGQFRRGKAVAVKDNADQAVAGVESIEHVLVVKRTGDDIPWTEGRDVWWHDTVDAASEVHDPDYFRCSSSTPRAPRENPRASCTPRADISPRHPSPTGPSSTPNPTMCTGARPTSRGSRRTPTRSTARSRTASRR